jgi:hypothetical protein
VLACASSHYCDGWMVAAPVYVVVVGVKGVWW